jgi:hypothetical protein
MGMAAEQPARYFPEQVRAIPLPGADPLARITQ